MNQTKRDEKQYVRMQNPSNFQSKKAGESSKT